MAASGLITMPVIEDSYIIGNRRVTIESDVQSWYAVQTAPQMEVKASAEMVKLGHICRVPMRTYFKQTRRTDKQGKFIKVEVQAPLCTGYAFLGVVTACPDWRIIRSRDGVQNVVGVRGTPHPIRSVAKLHAIFAADEAGKFDDTKVVEWNPEPGTSVRIISGPFEGFIAQIKRAKGDAARIIIDGLFGGTDVEMKKEHLEPA